jgi:transposase InsO family protein
MRHAARMMPQRGRLRELAQERRRFGYRRLHILLGREGMAMNHEAVPAVSRRGLSVRKRGGRKRAMGTRSPMMLPDGPNQRWSLDFVSDALNNGRRFRVLTVVDDYTRECLALVADTSLSGERLGRELDRIGEHRGWPLMIVSDNGTEMTSNAILAWQRRSDRCCGTISHRASRSRTGSSRASTAGSAMNASMSICSVTSPTPGRSSRTGGPTTTPSGLTPASMA